MTIHLSTNIKFRQEFQAYTERTVINKKLYVKIKLRLQALEQYNTEDRTYEYTQGCRNEPNKSEYDASQNPVKHFQKNWFSSCGPQNTNRYHERFRL